MPDRLPPGCWFMHTLDGKPAYFDGEQIVYAEILPRWQDDFEAVRLRRTLRAIRNDQSRSLGWRKAQGFSETFTYGYVVVSVGPRRSFKGGQFNA